MCKCIFSKIRRQIANEKEETQKLAGAFRLPEASHASHGPAVSGRNREHPQGQAVALCVRDGGVERASLSMMKFKNGGGSVCRGDMMAPMTWRRLSQRGNAVAFKKLHLFIQSGWRIPQRQVRFPFPFFPL